MNELPGVPVLLGVRDRVVVGVDGRLALKLERALAISSAALLRFWRCCFSS